MRPDLQKHIKHVIFIFIATIFLLCFNVLLTITTTCLFFMVNWVKSRVLQIISGLQHLMVLTMRCTCHAATWRTWCWMRLLGSQQDQWIFPGLAASCKWRSAPTTDMLCQRRQHLLVPSMSRLSDDSPGEEKKRRSCQAVSASPRHADVKGLKIISCRFCVIWTIKKASSSDQWHYGLVQVASLQTLQQPLNQDLVALR